MATQAEPATTPTAEPYARYEAAFESIVPPFAFVDLDAMRANVTDLLGMARGVPIRVASKSVRCRACCDGSSSGTPAFAAC